MAKPVVLETKGRRVETLARDVHALTKQGQDVVLTIGENVPPERILKIIGLCTAGYDVNLVVRHAELREYFEHAIIGATIGGGVGAAGVLAAIAVGNPVTLGAALAAIGFGALLGGAIGLATTPISQLTVYKLNGETRLKFQAAS